MRRSRMSALAGAAATMALFAASPAGALGARVPDPLPTPIPPSGITVGLATVASGLVNPVTATTAPDDEGSLYVAEQSGLIWRIAVGDDHDRDGDDHDDDGRVAGPGGRTLVADLRGVVLPLGCFFINYDERGLFGLAFHPDFDDNGLLYTYASQTPAGAATLPPNQCNARQPDHDNVVTEWRVRRDGTVDPASAREVLRNPHPQFNHNGGELRFGPDGLLYVAIGDGGAADDQGPGHAPGGNAQDLSSLNGKILRIDPNAGSGVPGHSIPRGNPFVSTPGARGEIYALGFRNPFKMSFDGGRLYVADVGQNDVEEVDVVTKGGNYGWPRKEGTFAFDQNGAANGFVTADAVAGFADPIAQYDHCLGPVPATQAGPCPTLEGTAIVGGFVYRGEDVKALRGSYVFGDYSRSFFTSDGRLFVTDRKGGPVRELSFTHGPKLGMSVLGIGMDADGELYVLGKTGARPGNTGVTDPANTTGVVMKLVSAGGDDD